MGPKNLLYHHANQNPSIKTKIIATPDMGLLKYKTVDKKLWNWLSCKTMISPGIEPGTFSVLTKCDNRYTNKPQPTRKPDVDIW